jgi:hypothetical protein
VNVSLRCLSLDRYESHVLRVIRSTRITSDKGATAPPISGPPVVHHGLSNHLYCAMEPRPHVRRQRRMGEAPRGDLDAVGGIP